MEPKYPNITVDFSNIDGNPLALIGAVTRALKDNNVAKSEIDLFRQEAMSGDYNGEEDENE